MVVSSANANAGFSGCVAALEETFMDHIWRYNGRPGMQLAAIEADDLATENRRAFARGHREHVVDALQCAFFPRYGKCSVLFEQGSYVPVGLVEPGSDTAMTGGLSFYKITGSAL